MPAPRWATGPARTRPRISRRSPPREGDWNDDVFPPGCALPSSPPQRLRHLSRRRRRTARTTRRSRSAASCPTRPAAAPTSSRASCRSASRRCSASRSSIDNRGGAAGSLGTEIAAKSAPDGYTVLFTLSSHTINPAIYPKLPFDTAEGLRAGRHGRLAAADPGRQPASSRPTPSPSWSRSPRPSPAALSFASVGNGSPGHLAGELFKLRTGTQMTHIPYRGGGPAVTDVMGGQVPLLWVSIPGGRAVRQVPAS